MLPHGPWLTVHGSRDLGVGTRDEMGFTPREPQASAGAACLPYVGTYLSTSPQGNDDKFECSRCTILNGWQLSSYKHFLAPSFSKLECCHPVVVTTIKIITISRAIILYYSIHTIRPETLLGFEPFHIGSIDRYSFPEGGKRKSKNNRYTDRQWQEAKRGEKKGAHLFISKAH